MHLSQPLIVREADPELIAILYDEGTDMEDQIYLLHSSYGYESTTHRTHAAARDAAVKLILGYIAYRNTQIHIQRVAGGDVTHVDTVDPRDVRKEVIA